MCTKSCTPKVEAALRSVPGVDHVVVSLAEKSAVVTGCATVEALIAAVNATGKRASLPSVDAVLSAIPQHCFQGQPDSLASLSSAQHGSERYRAALLQFAQTTCCPHSDCPCDTLCPCGATCACGSTRRTDDQWRHFVEINFSQLEQSSQAALRLSSELNVCPFNDCPCGLNCGCGSKCQCGSTPRLLDDWHRLAIARLRVGLQPAQSSLREADSWLAGRRAASTPTASPTAQQSSRFEKQGISLLARSLRRGSLVLSVAEVSPHYHCHCPNSLPLPHYHCHCHCFTATATVTATITVTVTAADTLSLSRLFPQFSSGC